MGGKPKQTPRTKNHMRPSSSGKSAELLSNITGATGFSTIEKSSAFGIVPGCSFDAVNDDNEAGLNDDVRIVLKKLSKKDPVTKQKGLQELSDLITQLDVDAVKQFLPYWPKYYLSLSTENDHRIREITQRTQAEILTKVGKNIAPYLKSLCGPWVTGQFDVHNVAAAIAKKSYEESFPTVAKQRDMMTYCETELLGYLTRNMFSTDSSNISPTSNYSPEELKEKQQRLIVTSLRTYNFYLQRMDDNFKSIDKTGALLDNAKFWAYHKHENSNVQSAWYEFMLTLLNRHPSLLTTHYEQLTRSTFKFIDNSNSLVMPFIWDCIVLIQCNYPSWYTHVSVEKLVLPKLWTMLRSGGFGNASIVFPYLLPFISNINKNTIGDQYDTFHEKFISSMCEAIKFNNHNKQEMNAIVKAYFEIFKYAIIQLGKESCKSDDCLCLIDDHIIALIDWTINVKSSASIYIYSGTTHLISYWEANPNMDINGEALKHFWKRLFTIIELNLAKKTDIERSSTAIVELVRCLKNSFGAKTALGVNHTKSNSKYRDMVCDIIKLYMALIEDVKEIILVEHMGTILREDPGLFIALTNDWQSLHQTIKNWLQNETLCCESAVEIVFMLLNYFEPDQKQDAIKDLAKNKKKNVKIWILQRLVSHPFCTYEWTPSIISLPEIRLHLVESAKSVVAGDTCEHLNLLRKCFFQTEAGNILIDVETCNEIIDTISLALNSTEDNDNIDTCASFIAQIFPVLCNDVEKKSLQISTFHRLFHFSIRNVATPKLSEDTLWEVSTSWEDALSCGDIVMDGDIIRTCSNEVDCLLTETNDINSVENIGNLCAKLISSAADTIDDQNCSAASQISEWYKIVTDLNDEFPKTVEYLEKYCLFVVALNGCKLDNNDSGITFVDMEIERYLDTLLKFSVLKITILQNLLEMSKDSEKSSDRFWNENSKNEYLSVIHAVNIGNILEKKCSKVQKKLLQSLTDKFATLTKCFPTEVQGDIKMIWYNWIKTNCKLSVYSLNLLKYFNAFEKQTNPSLAVFDDITKIMNIAEGTKLWSDILKVTALKAAPGTIPLNETFFEDSKNLYEKVVTSKCIVQNNFGITSFNKQADQKVIKIVVKLLHEISSMQKEKPFLKYATDISKEPALDIALVLEIIELMTHAVNFFPTELDKSLWDFVRLALSAWVLTVSKSAHSVRTETVALFISKIYELYARMQEFIKEESVKSSTELLTAVIQEWNDVFAKETNSVLLQSYLSIVDDYEGLSVQHRLFDSLVYGLTAIDLTVDTDIEKQNDSLRNLLTFSIENISNPIHSVRYSCATFIKSLIPSIIKVDQKQISDMDEADEKEYLVSLQYFEHKMNVLQAEIVRYMFESNVESKDDALIEFDKDVARSYLFLWNTILQLCSAAPAELKAVYTSWISKNKYEVSLLSFLFKLFLKEFATSLDYAKKIFANTTWDNMRDENVPILHLAGETYVFALRSIPAIVRKWYNGLHPKQAELVEKVSINSVAQQICHDEFNFLVKKKNVFENMSIKVYTPSRQIIATYSIDEANFELIITLPANYPLGCVKVEAGKQIGGRLQSRQTVMQCTIFLTHQNGSIWDGLTLWKRNLDRKFEGVEECFICYAVIHQDTYHLPRQTCKTCKKKFHGRCLYKWFSTSNKSSCPICRNIF